MKYSQVIIIAIGGVALGVSATPIAAPRQGSAFRKASETLETVAEGVDGSVGAAGLPHAMHQSHKAHRKNLYKQHSFGDARISEHTDRVLQTDTTPQPAKSVHRKENREPSAGEQDIDLPL